MNWSTHIPRDKCGVGEQSPCERQQRVRRVSCIGAVHEKRGYGAHSQSLDRGPAAEKALCEHRVRDHGAEHFDELGDGRRIAADIHGIEPSALRHRVFSQH